MLGPPKPRRLDQPVTVSLEALVPADHFYRHLEAKLDLGFVRDWVKGCYAERGRPSIDPVVFFKLQLVPFFEGLRSERKLIETASLHLAHRWYLGYALDEPLPDHSSLTRIRQRLGVAIFARFFEHVVDLCQAAGLVWGRELYFDATKVRANAALDSLVPRFYHDATAHVADLFADDPAPMDERGTDADDSAPSDELLRLSPRAARTLLRGRIDEQGRFWARQAINLGTTLLLLLGLLSIWFDDPTRLATALGLVTAGLAFALQRVVTAVAGYVVILRGNTFAVGDRITMGGVRGDVIRLGLIQTTIMEMGQPPAVQGADPAVQGADPAVWVRSRQYTGRVVTVSNAQIFDEPVYNYTRDFPYLWEEIALPIPYAADRERAERILLGAAERHTAPIRDASRRALERMHGRYFFQPASVEPTVYYRLTDNWLELTLRFVTEARGVRDVKDAMGRDILRELDAAGIGLASATVEIVGFPPLRVQEVAKHDA